MWFDARVKLAEIAGDTPPATSATQALPVSQLSQAPVAEYHFFVAKVASVAAPQERNRGVFKSQKRLFGRTGAVIDLHRKYGKTPATHQASRAREGAGSCRSQIYLRTFANTSKRFILMHGLEALSDGERTAIVDAPIIERGAK